jgi:hypothetical protein
MQLGELPRSALRFSIQERDQFLNNGDSFAPAFRERGFVFLNQRGGIVQP